MAVLTIARLTITETIRRRIEEYTAAGVNELRELRHRLSQVQ